MLCKSTSPSYLYLCRSLWLEKGLLMDLAGSDAGLGDRQTESSEAVCHLDNVSYRLLPAGHMHSKRGGWPRSSLAQFAVIQQLIEIRCSSGILAIVQSRIAARIAAKFTLIKKWRKDKSDGSLLSSTPMFQ